jgi:hypothetical protein
MKLSARITWAAVAALASQALPAVADSIITDWNNSTLEAIRQAKPGPPIVARALAVVHTCTYDAWAAYDATALGTRYNEYLRRPAAERTDLNKTIAISYAAYRALVDLFPAQKALFDQNMASLGFDPNDTSTDRTTPVGIGNLVSTAVLKFRHGDGSNQLGDMGGVPYSDTTGYKPVNDVDHIMDPNHWQPLRFSNGQGGFVIPGYIAPHWGTVVPFALKSADQFRPPPPAQYPKDLARYVGQAEEIITFTATLTDRTKMIAEYWADGPKSELPPGHWNLFAQFVSKRDRFTLDQDAKLFFALDNAVFDAGIATWECKRYYDSERPITAIHFLKAGKMIKGWVPFKGTQLIKGEDWIPYQPATFVTPPFPEHTSGHSAFSAAAAQVLKSFTGSDRFGNSVTFKPGSSHTEPGLTPSTTVTLSWNTFTEAADEAGISRRYGGIHFLAGDLEGRQLGRRVGRQTWLRALRYFNSPRVDRSLLRDDPESLDRDDIRTFGFR